MDALRSSHFQSSGSRAAGLHKADTLLLCLERLLGSKAHGSLPLPCPEPCPLQAGPGNGSQLGSTDEQRSVCRELKVWSGFQARFASSGPFVCHQIPAQALKMPSGVSSALPNRACVLEHHYFPSQSDSLFLGLRDHRPGTEPRPQAVNAPSVNHQTARDFPQLDSFWST